MSRSQSYSKKSCVPYVCEGKDGFGVRQNCHVTRFGREMGGRSELDTAPTLYNVTFSDLF